jgi:hypothetical protein
MQTSGRKTSVRIMRRRNTGANKQGKAPVKIRYAAYNGIDDFLRSYPIFTLNEYGERIISGRRIC